MVKENMFHLNIINRVAFAHVNSLDDLKCCKYILDENIAKSKIIAFAIIFDLDNSLFGIEENFKNKLFCWLQGLEVISLAVINSHCSREMLQLIMMFDMRLGGDKTSANFENCEDTYQLIVGNEREERNKEFQANKCYAIDELCRNRFINNKIDVKDIETKVMECLHKMIDNRSDNQIRCIKKCFNNYRLRNKEFGKKPLLYDEFKQFCILVTENHSKRKE